MKSLENKAQKNCVNRTIVGICKNCTRDYENHFPNNYDCKNYSEIHMLEIEVERGNLLKLIAYQTKLIYRRISEFFRGDKNI